MPASDRSISELSELAVCAQFRTYEDLRRASREARPRLIVWNLPMDLYGIPATEIPAAELAEAQVKHPEIGPGEEE